MFYPRNVVFNIGEIGKKFYIILKGDAYVLVNKAIQPQDNSSLKKDNNKKS